MKKSRIIITAILVTLFVISTILNVFMFRSSYGTLLFKYNESKFASMAGSRYLEFTPIYFLDKSDSGIQIEYISNKSGKIEKHYYSFHFDKGSNMTAKLVDIDSANTKTQTYYITNTIYQQTKDSKTKQEANETTLVTNLFKNIVSYQSMLLNDITEKDTKTKIDFSFSPFYVLGVKYNVGKTMTFHYDLNGKLRKIEAKLTDGTKETYTFTYKNKQISLPNLERFA